ncbi:MAG: alpha/beta hydrolase [Gammaproteobacteria bacterium]
MARDDLLAAAARAGFTTSSQATPAGPVRILARGLAGATQVDVYIEGDGHAWRTRTRKSADPTPRQPLALALALADPAPAVLYLARPCHYASAAELAACDARYWTAARYGTEVIGALDAALDNALAAAAAPPRLGLVGYSGGAVIATHLAARRDDVDWMVAVAGNLDPAAWTAHHRVSPLEEADAMLAQAAVDTVPQVILLGGADDIVPPALVARYQAARDPAITVSEVVDDYDHRCCWVDNWPRRPCRLLGLLGIAAPALCGAP